MKKFLLLPPVGLLAASEFIWITFNQDHINQENTVPNHAVPYTSQELFSESERLLRQIIRHGDSHSMQSLQESLDKISEDLNERKKQGFAVENIEALLADYQQESLLLNQKFTPYLNDLHQSTLFEEEHEKSFMAAVEQIGLYELKTSYSDLNKLRLSYIKEPSLESKNAYDSKMKELKSIISDLYLDSAIEAPLFAYLNNHQFYLETLYRAYIDLGYERIYHLRKNSYTIKTELQLLPTL